MVELETEKKKVEDITAELEERKKREEDEQKDPAFILNQIYEKNIGSKVFIFSNEIINCFTRNIIDTLHINGVAVLFIKNLDICHCYFLLFFLIIIVLENEF